MTWIKICGTTSLEDARLAADAGVDAIGFVFAESKRKVTPEQAAEIVWELPETLTKIGVFVQDPAEVVESIVKVVGLSTVQLQVHEDWALAPRIAADNNEVEIIRVLHAGRGGAPAVMNEPVSDHMNLLLIDTAVHGRVGGTGQAWDWHRFAPAVEKLKSRFRIIVAGGLTPENVGDAISALRPWGVDVVTGVESEPGKKDPAKVRAFVEAVRRADAAAKA